MACGVSFVHWFFMQVFFTVFFPCSLSIYNFFFSVMGKFWMFTCIALRWESPIKSVSQRADRNAEHPSTKPFRGLPEMYWKDIKGKEVVWLKLVCPFDDIGKSAIKFLKSNQSVHWFFTLLNVSKFLGLWKLLSHSGSLRKQPTFRDNTTGFPRKWHLRNKCRNSILMTHHYPDLGSASDWLKQI